MFTRSWLVAAVVAAVVVGVVLWISRPAASASCDAPVEDPLDPRSLQHALAGPPVSYTTEPPTSGPHQPGRLAGGVVAEPLPGPVQVGALEAGQVLVQHHDLAPSELSRLEALAGPLVIVAPNPALPKTVVASAWRTRLLCREIDDSALARFIEDHAGHSPQHGG